MSYGHDTKRVISLRFERSLPDTLGNYVILPQLSLDAYADAIIVTDPSGETRYALIDHEYQFDAWDIPLLESLLGYDPAIISDDFHAYWTDDDGEVDAPISVFRIHEVGAVDLLAHLACAGRR